MVQHKQCEVAIIFYFPLAEVKTIINHGFTLPYAFKRFQECQL